MKRTNLVLAAAILAQAAGNVFLTRGMKAAAAAAGLNDTATWLDQARAAVGEPEIWVGTVLLVTFFALCSAALSWADLSYVIPATAAGYALNVAAGQFILHEPVTTARWLGCLVVTAGVVCVSWSARRGTTPSTGPGL